MSIALPVYPITTDQYEQFEGYPGLKDELIYGAIYLSPQAKPLHQQVASNVNRSLDQALRGQNYITRQNSNIRFRNAASMPAPDVFVFSREDWKRACETDDYLCNAPVLVIEVLSPANRKKRVDLKVDLYLSQGVKEIWLIHPKRGTFEVVYADGQRIQPQQECSHTLPEPLQGRVEIQSFFRME